MLVDLLTVIHSPTVGWATGLEKTSKPPSPSLRRYGASPAVGVVGVVVVVEVDCFDAPPPHAASATARMTAPPAARVVLVGDITRAT
jgi:hypothetical protein